MSEKEEKSAKNRGEAGASNNASGSTSAGTEQMEEAVYERLAERLNEEKDRLENELRQDYRLARNYVRTNPEEGLAIAFASGFVLGVLITKLFRSR